MNEKKEKIDQAHQEYLKERAQVDAIVRKIIEEDMK
jgi:hypothetical protein